MYILMKLTKAKGLKLKFARAQSQPQASSLSMSQSSHKKTYREKPSVTLRMN